MLGALAGTVLGVAVSLVAGRGRSPDTVVAAIALVLQFFSGVFFVYSKLPPWIRDVAAVVPLKWLTQGMRSAFLPDQAKRAEVAGSWQHGRTALVLLAWVVVGVLVCARGFRWRRQS
jgi:ABC-2 type transport system permease protein